MMRLQSSASVRAVALRQACRRALVACAGVCCVLAARRLHRLRYKRLAAGFTVAAFGGVAAAVSVASLASSPNYSLKRTCAGKLSMHFHTAAAQAA